MRQQPQQLNLLMGQRLKERGMGIAAEKSHTNLDRIREIALALAIAYGEVTADDVWRHILKHRLDIPKGPYWGSLFKEPEWVFTGKRIRSALPANHARELKVWRLKGR